MSDSPKLTRRSLCIRSGAAVLGGALVLPVACEQLDADERKPPEDGAASACDFQSSFMTWEHPSREDPRPYARHNTPHGNLARIQLDAIIDVVQIATGDSQRFVLIAPCRTEWVYAEDRLFQLPSREYRNIYSLSQQRGMSHSITDTGERSRGGPVSPTFRSLAIDVRTFAQTRRLSTAADIVKATAKNVPLVGRTAIEDPDGAVRYILEYPIQTMNFQPKTNSFQVDTGPLLVPDFKANEPQTIDRLEMAHIAYNRLDRAEFILRRPTKIKGPDDQTLCEVLHYSEVREDLANNVILAGKRAS
jgi:hypothetical protein